MNPIAAISASVARITAPPGRPHETRGASVVRPVVFGATDGFVCNLSLIMGVAAAAKEDPHAILVAGDRRAARWLLLDGRR